MLGKETKGLAFFQQIKVHKVYRADPTVSIWLPTFPVHSFHPFCFCLQVFCGEGYKNKWWETHTPPNVIINVVHVAKFTPPFCKGNVVIPTANNTAYSCPRHSTGIQRQHTAL